ncbi:hypothetical protein GCM10007421_20810 [Halopseudomonas oceani]|uniref:Uncharacterized protein n=1 Tax=Halopseudomonas oceani TaxID=1708783 RepID=A0A2P4EW47_9GAMM|nr:hypothetical protein C1949_08895 [Halopseudomonas oceani]GGE46444.1 hypothetical protein GCM10007421_20810 [Halopseudomonas oceani]
MLRASAGLLGADILSAPVIHISLLARQGCMGHRTVLSLLRSTSGYFDPTRFPAAGDDIAEAVRRHGAIVPLAAFLWCESGLPLWPQPPNFSEAGSGMNFADLFILAPGSPMPGQLRGAATDPA